MDTKMADDKKIQPFEEEKEPSSARLVLTLGIAGFLSGLILVSVFLLTKPLIAQNKQEALEEAIYKVLPGAKSYETLELKNGELIKTKETTQKSGKGEEPEKIFLGYNGDGALVGFAIPASGAGFQDIIETIFGYRANTETIIGFEVLESKETPGLGDKIFKDPDFKKNFTSLKVEPKIEPISKGSKTKDNQVETITGATISSKSVINLLNNAVDKWKPLIEKYVKNNKINWANEKAS